ncbi:MAG: host attachment protein [Thiobacillaceae bacterium]
MSTTWVLVANAAQAKLYTNHGPNKGLHLVTEYAHPESREKGRELVTDRPGHNPGQGNGHGSYVPQKDPKQNAAEHFARYLAGMLDKSRSEGNYERLIVAASSPFIGVLKQHLTAGVSKLITASVDRDYTGVGERELPGLLASYAVL